MCRNTLHLGIDCAVCRLVLYRIALAQVQRTCHVSSAKGLTMTKALAVVLAPCFTLMRRFQFYPKISHVPCRLNVGFEKLSWFKQKLSWHLDPNGCRTIPWRALLQRPSISVAQHGRKWPSHFNIQQRKKKVPAIRRLGASID